MAFAVGVVHTREQVRHPGQLKFHDSQLEIGIALEYARKDHVAHRRRRIKNFRGPATRIAERFLPRTPDFPLSSRGGVQTKRHIEGLGSGPEWLVLWLVVAPVLGWILGNHGAGKAHF